MVEKIGIDMSQFLDGQIRYQETLEINLYKAKALIQMALGEDFPTYDKDVIDGYFLTLIDLLEESKSINQKSQKELLRKIWCIRYLNIATVPLP